MKTLRVRYEAKTHPQSGKELADDSWMQAAQDWYDFLEGHEQREKDKAESDAVKRGQVLRTQRVRESMMKKASDKQPLSRLDTPGTQRSASASSSPPSPGYQFANDDSASENPENPSLKSSRRRARARYRETAEERQQHRDLMQAAVGALSAPSAPAPADSRLLDAEARIARLEGQVQLLMSLLQGSRRKRKLSMTDILDDDDEDGMTMYGS
jgi:hypothetical protein